MLKSYPQMRTETWWLVCYIRTIHEPFLWKGNDTVCPRPCYTNIQKSSSFLDLTRTFWLEAHCKCCWGVWENNFFLTQNILNVQYKTYIKNRQFKQRTCKLKRIQCIVVKFGGYDEEYFKLLHYSQKQFWKGGSSVYLWKCQQLRIAWSGEEVGYKGLGQHVQRHEHQICQGRSLESGKWTGWRNGGTFGVCILTAD